MGIQPFIQTFYLFIEGIVIQKFIEINRKMNKSHFVLNANYCVMIENSKYMSLPDGE